MPTYTHQTGYVHTRQCDKSCIAWLLWPPQSQWPSPVSLACAVSKSPAAAVRTVAASKLSISCGTQDWSSLCGTFEKSTPGKRARASVTGRRLLLGFICSKPDHSHMTTSGIARHPTVCPQQPEDSSFRPRWRIMSGHGTCLQAGTVMPRQSNLSSDLKVLCVTSKVRTPKHSRQPSCASTGTPALSIAARSLLRPFTCSLCAISTRGACAAAPFPPHSSVAFGCSRGAHPKAAAAVSRVRINGEHTTRSTCSQIDGLLSIVLQPACKLWDSAKERASSRHVVCTMAACEASRTCVSRFRKCLFSSCACAQPLHVQINTQSHVCLTRLLGSCRTVAEVNVNAFSKHNIVGSAQVLEMSIEETPCVRPTL